MLILTVVILPINAFGSGQQHSNSGSPQDPTALVHHLFKGSWKADHPPAGPKQPLKRKNPWTCMYWDWDDCARS